MPRVIKKVGGIILDDHRRLLVVKKEVPGRDTYIIPGGRPEGAETEEQTLRRELTEELGVGVETLVHFGNFSEKAEFEDALLEMSVYEVRISGTPSPQSEIVSMMWVDSNYAAAGISLGSTLVNDVIPGLVAQGRM